jgi:hypothetical protein
MSTEKNMQAAHKTQSQQTPDLSHPVVTMARMVARLGTDVGSTETFVIDADGEAKLEACLLKHAGDPTLPSGIAALFGLATALSKDYNSPTAATVIFAVIGKCSSRLPMLGPLCGLELIASGQDAEHLQKASAISMIGRAEALTAPRVGQKAPAGSIQAGTLAANMRRRLC